MAELGWKYLQRWQDRRRLGSHSHTRSSLDIDKDQYIPLIQTSFQESTADSLAFPSSSYEPSGLPISLLSPTSVFDSPNMVNFSTAPDEIIAVEKRNEHAREVPIDTVDMDNEKPYATHLETQQSVEGHSLGPLSTRDTEKNPASIYGSTIDGEDGESFVKAEKKMLRKLGTLRQEAKMRSRYSIQHHAPQMSSFCRSPPFCICPLISIEVTLVTLVFKASRRTFLVVTRRSSRSHWHASTSVSSSLEWRFS